jgi:hypothetical protein
VRINIYLGKCCADVYVRACEIRSRFRSIQCHVSSGFAYEEPEITHTRSLHNAENVSPAPSKDAKGGRATHAGLTSAGIPIEDGAPKPYYFGKAVTYMTRSGKVLDEDAVKRRPKVAIPIHVHYRGEGANRTIDRVILDEG